MKPRKQRPVFVIGCHRSGTNLLYDTLLSAGGFAVYRACPTVYETLLPYCGDLAVPRNRKKLTEVWLRSKPFRRTGLPSEEVRSRILGECKSGGDFLRIIMGEVAHRSNAQRWVVYGPDNVLYIPAIKRDLPDALFVHIVRDGRDIALSLTKMGGLRPLWWDRRRNLFATALYWQWMVRKGRNYGQMFPDDYAEVHYEDLVQHPRETLGMLSQFLDHDLDYDRILDNGLGRVHEPNSTFSEQAQGQTFNPIDRWKEKLSASEISGLQRLVGSCLEEFGYPLVRTNGESHFGPKLGLMSGLYTPYFETKLWLKTHTPLGRLASTNALELTKARDAMGTKDETEPMIAWNKTRGTLPWVPAYYWQLLTRRAPQVRPVHLIISLADHFEPAIIPQTMGQRAERDVQEERLERWCRQYPKAVCDWPDHDGRTFRHTYFYPAEQYDAGLVDTLAQHCREGWGEVEIHLHHGIDAPGTPETTRQTLVEFRQALVGHGCLSQLDGRGGARYAFVHGNFALANSMQGRFCGVDSEIEILAETGCYADFTLPSSPNPAQTTKINALYECNWPLSRPSAHRQGRDLRSGRFSPTLPLMIQGPLLLDFSRRSRHWPLPTVENGAITGTRPPTMGRLRLWTKAGITVEGRPDWLFIKLYCHGMDPRDEESMLGGALRKFLRQLMEESRGGREYRVHFTTAREMTNIVLAACDGCEGNPNDYRDYRLQLLADGKDHLQREQEHFVGSLDCK
jgi:hypothetical protein